MVFSDPTLTAIVDTFQQHSETLRLRKLMYATCHHRWENDPQVLQNTPLPGLIQTLHHQAPTLAALEGQLTQVAKQLNKPERYLALSQMLLQILRPLYIGSVAESIAHSEDAVAPPLPLTPAPAARGAISVASLDYDHFEARLAVIKYANPLRAKILIFSAIAHPFNFSRQDWDSLQQWSLDRLIRQLLQDYTRLGLLEQHLGQLAAGFAELAPLEQMGQDAEAIIRAVRPLYEQTTAVTAEATQSLPTAFNAPVDLTTLAPGGVGAGPPDLGDDSDADLTCQFFVRPK